MRPLDLHSERYSPTGNIASAGVRNQLGRPSLDPVTLLVREAVQNCWDARLRDDEPVRVAFEVEHVDGARRQRWADLVYAQQPKHLDARERLLDFDSEWLLMTISDRGTWGLGGPTRADVVTAGDVPTDFVDFLRNLGSPPDKEYGGGTFGFGKAALYAMSGIGSILVYTRCRHLGKIETRLMGAGLGGGYVAKDERGKPTRFTGRHWWGRWRDRLVEPLRGGEADAVAQRLGLPGFDEGDTGTTIAIVDFRLGDEISDRGRARTFAQLRRDLLEALTWNFWPKMVPGPDGALPMTFQIRMDGEDVPVVPTPDTPALEAMTAALEEARQLSAGSAEPSPDTTFEITRQRQTMGWLVLRHFMTRKTPGTWRNAEALGGSRLPPRHHVAWMRSAELVVKYHEAPPIEADGVGYAGVFVVANEHFPDRAFAAAEPPTHDDWVEKNLQDAIQRSIVHVSLKKMRSHLREFVASKARVDVETDSTPLGTLSEALGGILIGIPGPGAAIPKQKKRPKPRGRGPRVVEADEEEWGSVSEASEPNLASTGVGGDDAVQEARRMLGRPTVRAEGTRLVLHDNVPALSIVFKVRRGNGSKATAVTADARVRIDGGTEKEAPAGAATPEIIAWIRPDGRVVRADGEKLTINAKDDGQWTVLIGLIDDAEVRASVSGRPVEWD